MWQGPFPSCVYPGMGGEGRPNSPKEPASPGQPAATLTCSTWHLSHKWTDAQVHLLGLSSHWKDGRAARFREDWHHPEHHLSPASHAGTPGRDGGQRSAHPHSQHRAPIHTVWLCTDPRECRREASGCGRVLASLGCFFLMHHN